MTDRLNTIFRECVTSIDYAENIIVIHTLAGMANAAGAALDAMKLEEIVGTIAGDDTIMMAVRTKEDTQTVMQKIEELIQNVK